VSRRQATAEAGVLFVDKPVGPTSREVLDELERRLELGPLGHAGTLDPLASGLLVVLAGGARRLQEHFMGGLKHYQAEICFGVVSKTLDGEGPLTPGANPPPQLERALLEPLLARFLGEISQVPPAHSALHIHGRRAHRLARKGASLTLPPRQVHIQALEILEIHSPRLLLQVDCGPGTYIRSLARDLGEALGSGAYLSALRRCQCGSFKVEEAAPPSALTRQSLQPLSKLLSAYPRLDVTSSLAQKLSQGASIPASLEAGPKPAFAWCGGRPFCRLRQEPNGHVRSARLLEPPGSFLDGQPTG